MSKMTKKTDASPNPWGGTIPTKESMTAFLETAPHNLRLREGGQRWLNVCEQAAAFIDPETAEIKCEARSFLDPYGVFLDIPKDVFFMTQYFARSPGSNIWVAWKDLPPEVEDRLWRKHKNKHSALRHPLSCWASFCNSSLYRKGAPGTPLTENDIRYLRLMCWGPSSAKEAKALWQATHRSQ